MRQHHRAEGAEEEQDVELAALEPVLAQIPAGEQGTQASAQADGDVEEEREGVRRQVGAHELGQLGRRRASEQRRHRDGRGDEERRSGHQRELGAFGDERVDQHDQEPCHQQDHHRRECEQDAHRMSPGCPGSSCSSGRRASRSLGS